MESFYGGRKGNSFTIKKRYESIAAMNAEIGNAGLNLDIIGYGEYVIIDSVWTKHNPSDPDNGKVFYRGFEQMEEVGQIVGPPGVTTEVKLKDKIALDNKKTEEIEWGVYNMAEDTEIGSSGINLVSGKDKNEITYEWLKVRDQWGNIQGAWFAFEIPYLVLDISAESVSPYDEAEVELLSDIDETPFYENWNIKVPKGIKGDALNNLKVIKASNTDGIAEYAGQADDRAKGREILVFDTVNYNNSAEGNIIHNYLGDYNMIKSLNLAANGTLSVTYTHNDNQILSQKIKWVTSITVDLDGNLKVNYNDGTHDDSIVKLYKNIAIDTGTKEGEGSQKLKVEYTTGDIDTIGNPLNYIMETLVTKYNSSFPNTDPYHLVVLFSDPALRQAMKGAGRCVAYHSEKFNEDRDDFVDLGYVRGEIGNLNTIAKVNSKDDFKNVDGSWRTPKEVAAAVGLQWSDDYAGWCWTFPVSDDTAEFWAYDYATKEWYPVGTISTSDPSQIILVSEVGAGGKPASTDNLGPGGLWLVKASIENC